MSLEDKLYPLLDMYYRLPQPIAVLIGRVYASLPESFTMGQSYEYFTRAAERVVAADNADYLNREFLKTIKVASHIPFYQKYYSEYGVGFNEIKDLSDICRLPTISKSGVKNNIKDMVNPEHEGKGLYLTTGGSTGMPVGFYLEKGVTRVKESAFINFLWKKKGYDRRSRIAIIRGQNFNTKDGVSKLDPIKNALMLSSYGLVKDNLEVYLERLNLFQPDFIQAYPSSIYLLARMMKDSDTTLAFTPKYIFCGSENIYPDHIKTIESVFKAKVFSWYGHTERVLLAKMLDDGRYEFFDHYGVSELIDNDGFQITTGVGELCGTSLHNSVMPLIRYRTQDLAELASECDRSDFTKPMIVKKIEGRAHEFVYSKTKRPVSMTALNMHNDIFDSIERFQFKQTEYGVVDFIYTGKVSIGISEIGKIKHSILSKLGEGFELGTQKVDRISLARSGKQSFLAQELSFD